ncbi:DEAD/DEAH box helicase family protein [Cryptosporidium serpentis]
MVLKENLYLGYDCNELYRDKDLMHALLEVDTGQAFKLDVNTNNSNNLNNLTFNNETNFEIPKNNNFRYGLDFLDLDSRLIDHYTKKGLTKLYPWQYECITQPGVLQGKNLIYSAPTSGGKTLVSELLMFRTVTKRRRSALVILPFVSLVSEKRKNYCDAGIACNLSVHEFHYGSKTSLSESFDIGVATIEKANSLMNAYIEREILFDRLGIIIIDELHLLGDEQRGYILEVLLTKIRLLSRINKDILNNSNYIQIVGMSATLPNISSIGYWLDAVVYQTNFRPVPLREYIVIDGIIYQKPMYKESSKFDILDNEQDIINNIEMNDDSILNLLDDQYSIDKISKSMNFLFEDLLNINYKINNLYLLSTWNKQNLRSEINLNSIEIDEELINNSKWKYPIVDMKDLLLLAWEALCKGDSVLVFCPSKYSVETTALFYTRCLSKKFYDNIDVTKINRMNLINNDIIRRIEYERLQLIKELQKYHKKSKSTNISILYECISKGIAYHHSGLSYTERNIVEKGYRNGSILLLTATSTLAAGVNLPSKRVIFRGISIGKSFLTSAEYKQMSGRAGRAGQRGIYGESFILTNYKTEEFSKTLELITSDLLPLKSTFITNINGLARLILEIITSLSSNIAKFTNNIYNYTHIKVNLLEMLKECTLMSFQIQSKHYIHDLFSKVLSLLLNNRMIVKYNSESFKFGFTLDYMCTDLGRAVATAGLSPSNGYELYLELKKANSQFLIESPIFLTYMVTPFPPNNESISINNNKTQNTYSYSYYHINWPNLYEILCRSTLKERYSIKKLGFDIQVIGYVSQKGETNLPCQLKDKQRYRRYQRFYASLLLSSLIRGVPIKQIINCFQGITNSDIQQLLTSTITMSNSCIIFCQKLNWWSLGLIFQNYLQKIQNLIFIHPEISFSIIPSSYITVKKLCKTIKGMSQIGAIELINNLGIKTFKQFIIVPRNVLVHSIHTYLYSSLPQYLNFIENFVDIALNQSYYQNIRLPSYNSHDFLYKKHKFQHLFGYQKDNMNINFYDDKQDQIIKNELLSNFEVEKKFDYNIDINNPKSSIINENTHQIVDELDKILIKDLDNVNLLKISQNNTIANMDININSLINNKKLNSLEYPNDSYLEDYLQLLDSSISNIDELQNITDILEWEERITLWSTPLK